MNSEFQNVPSLEEAPKSILALQLKRLGDVLLTTPSMEMLHRTFPDAKIDLLVSPSLTFLDPLIPCCRILPAPSSPGEFLATARSQYDMLLDFSGQDRCLLIAALSRAKRKITFRKYWKKPFRKFVFHEAVKSSLRDQHVAEHLADLVRHAGAKGEAGPPCMWIPANEQEASRKKFGEAGIHGRYVLLHPGTARPEKFWSAEGWAHLADFLSTQAGCSVLLTGSGSPEETEHLNQIRSLSKIPHPCLNGCLSPGILFGLIEGASLFCGVDSAPLHAAEALKTPIFAIFGPTNPAEWGPRFTPHRCLTPSNEGQSAGSNLKDPISPAIALEKLREFLASIDFIGHS